ncbi:stage III sporulation protein AG [Alkalihalobacillus sp. LMS39]|uniref:stage III sporulation protein AG n=1 Tax=Alkalihalobacillus sp. LMS39 TaxID=2924032 RepID=UPI001FB24323|nr:stage III sporulation protein AG [Alkalihalobacillus sp. LMS39]UOE95920.1 stage III sporulation protein AG [Alkalihalobacillus sp. LMS39]
MDSGEKDKQWLKKLFEKGAGKNGKQRMHYVVMILCVGVALMILGNFFSNDETSPTSQPVFNSDQSSTDDQPVFGQSDSPEPNSMKDYEIRYENQLKEVLDQVVGVSEVSIMINLAETERNVYERNTNTKEQVTDETDREGGKRKVEDTTRDEQVVIVRNGDKEEAILVKQEKPEIRGVLVVAEGVENAQVKTWVVEAVSRVLDVPSHRVSVLPKKSKEE